MRYQLRFPYPDAAKIPVRMLWSSRGVRLKHGGNLRECAGWMNRENARRFANANGMVFVDCDEAKPPKP